MLERETEWRQIHSLIAQNKQVKPCWAVVQSLSACICQRKAKQKAKEEETEEKLAVDDLRKKRR